jgi:hypothetical protein
MIEKVIDGLVQFAEEYVYIYIILLFMDTSVVVHVEL